MAEAERALVVARSVVAGTLFENALEGPLNELYARLEELEWEGELLADMLTEATEPEDA